MQQFNVSRSAIFAILLCVLVLTGCMYTMGPRMPRELSAPAISSYSTNQFNTDVAAYRDDVKSGDLTAAKTVRNQIAYRVMTGIEIGYGRFEMHLTTTRAGAQTGSDALQLGLTAATSVVGTSDVKDILSATSTAFHGTWTSLDKNYFQDKTTEAIVSQMRATRKTKQAQIITSLATRDVASYPLEAAWIDLVDFYYAGTVPSALVEIASDAGTKADTATKDLNKAVADLTPATPAQAKQSIGNRTAYEKLKSAVNGTDPQQSAKALQTLRQILTAAGYAPKADASATELLGLFRQAIDEATNDDSKLATLSAAVAAANID